nr:rod-determining factor RdfA [Natrinema sp. CBA1119]
MSRLRTDNDDMYLQLTGEKGTSADQTRIRRQLEREGVDVETLQSDFVSYGAIRSFLKEERSAEYNPSQNPVERDTDSIQQLRNRTMLVTETKLNGLVENDHIELGSYEVTVDINVFCEECGRQFDVIDILEQKECDCKK